MAFMMTVLVLVLKAELQFCVVLNVIKFLVFPMNVAKSNLFLDFASTVKLGDSKRLKLC